MTEPYPHVLPCNTYLDHPTATAVTEFQKADVLKTITYTPGATAGIIAAKCNGKPIVTPKQNTSAGSQNSAYRFTITQSICIKVPVTFYAVPFDHDTFKKVQPQ